MYNIPDGADVPWAPWNDPGQDDLSEEEEDGETSPTESCPKDDSQTAQKV